MSYCQRLKKMSMVELVEERIQLKEEQADSSFLPILLQGLADSVLVILLILASVGCMRALDFLFPGGRSLDLMASAACSALFFLHVYLRGQGQSTSLGGIALVSRLSLLEVEIAARKAQKPEEMSRGSATHGSRLVPPGSPTPFRDAVRILVVDGYRPEAWEKMRMKALVEADAHWYLQQGQLEFLRDEDRRRGVRDRDMSLSGLDTSEAPGDS